MNNKLVEFKQRVAHLPFDCMRVEESKVEVVFNENANLSTSIVVIATVDGLYSYFNDDGIDGCTVTNIDIFVKKLTDKLQPKPEVIFLTDVNAFYERLSDLGFAEFENSNTVYTAIKYVNPDYPIIVKYYRNAPVKYIVWNNIIEPGISLETLDDVVDLIVGIYMNQSKHNQALKINNNIDLELYVKSLEERIMRLENNL